MYALYWSATWSLSCVQPLRLEAELLDGDLGLRVEKLSRRHPLCKQAIVEHLDRIGFVLEVLDRPCGVPFLCFELGLR